MCNTVGLTKRQPDRSMDRKESLEIVPGIYEVIYMIQVIFHIIKKRMGFPIKDILTKKKFFN